jgi:hypothetical protein
MKALLHKWLAVVGEGSFLFLGMGAVLAVLYFPAMSVALFMSEVVLPGYWSRVPGFLLLMAILSFPAVAFLWEMRQDEKSQRAKAS